MRPRVALVVTIAALFVGAPRAGAYCRTTTTQVPADYDPAVDGCLTGTALAWPSMPVTYQVFRGASAQASLADVTPVIDRSFAKWPAVSCSATDSTQHPELEVSDVGPTDAVDPCDGAVPCPIGRDSTHGIYFRDDSWPYMDSANELALTTVTYGVDDGHIFSAVMEINSNQHQFSLSVPAPEGSYSLEAVVSHEAGHFVGMAHSQETSAIMYAFYQGDAVALTDDDAAGVCAIYPQTTPSSGSSCRLVAAGENPGGSENGWAGGGALVAVVIAASYGRRRRRLTRSVTGPLKRPFTPEDCP
jgi:hypothetical protein